MYVAGLDLVYHRLTGQAYVQLLSSRPKLSNMSVHATLRMIAWNLQLHATLETKSMVRWGLPQDKKIGRRSIMTTLL